jgi:HEPN domain-containing protein
MVTREEVEILKKRALDFLENGKELFKKKSFDLAAFNFEQFCQLYLKHKLFLLLGDFPKTHSIKLLLQELAKVKKGKIVKAFLKKHASIIGNLENAYIASRYILRSFCEEEVEEMLAFSKKFKEFVDKL